MEFGPEGKPKRERYESSQGVLKPRVKEKGMREREGKVIKG